ncbi:MAG: group 1 truncated hemoglobin [Alphaproteobacteria bacterium]
MRIFKTFAAVVLAAGLGLSGLGLAGCAETKMEPPKPKSLYDRLGGKPAIEAVVDDFVARLAADRRINKRFAKSNIPKLKEHLVLQICETAGGPCKYTGKDMATAHKGMKITKNEFNITGQHLAASLDKFKVPEKEKNELMTAIGGMEKDIVGK